MCFIEDGDFDFGVGGVVCCCVGVGGWREWIWWIDWWFCIYVGD